MEKAKLIFELLVPNDFKSAVEIFYPINPNGEYEWNMITVYRDINKLNSTHEEELQYYCSAVETCLKIKILIIFKKIFEFSSS